VVGPAPVWVEGPPVTPRPFGLFTAAQVVDDTDARWLLGSRYEVDYCGEAVDNAGVCYDFGTLSIAVDDAAEATITADGFPDGSYTIDWGDDTDPDTVDDLDGETHTYADPGEYAVTVTGPRSYMAVVLITVEDGEASVAADAEVGVGKQARSGVEVVEGEGFAVLHLLECNPVGRDDLEERARRALQMGEQRAVERVVATMLARHPDAVALASSTELSVVDGLAVLEKYAAANYPGVPVIHATPDVVTIMDAKSVVRREGTTLQTVQGTLVASGGGYSPLRAPNPPDPDDGTTTPLTANAAGTEWLYVTGVVQVRRAAAIEVNGQIDTTGEGARNSRLYLAERPYVVTWECITAAVLVSTSEDGPS
jgi:hypothetical protein